MIVKNDGHLTKSPSTRNRNAKTEDGRKRDAGPSKINKDGVQGEGDYEAAREFNESERKFVASGKVAASSACGGAKVRSGAAGDDRGRIRGQTAGEGIRSSADESTLRFRDTESRREECRSEARVNAIF